MVSRLKALVVVQNERHRREFRHVLGKVELVRIEQEILAENLSTSKENLDLMGSLELDVAFFDMPDNPEEGLHQLEQIHNRIPLLPIVVVGSPVEASFLIRSMKFGVRECLPRSLNQEQLAEALHRLLQRTHLESQGEFPGSIFTFISSKGGNGTTTLVANLAVCLSKTSRKGVLIVDLDVQLGNVADWFGVRDNRYLFEEEPELSTWENEHIRRTIIKHPITGVDLLSLTRGFSRKSHVFPHELKRLLLHLKGEYGFVLVDTGNTLESNGVAALDLSDSIFLISKGDLPALRNAQQLLQVFSRLGYAQNKIRVVVNRHSRNDGIDLPQIEKVLGHKAFCTIPNDFKSVISSLQRGVPLTASAQELPFTKVLYNLSAEILRTLVECQAKPTPTGLVVRTKKELPESAVLAALNP